MTPEEEYEFDPREPHKDLWMRFLVKRPGKGSRPKMTATEKKAISLRVQNYYVNRMHPRKGKPFRNSDLESDSE